ncbi:MAG: phosphotransferase [Pseudomonadota bacterium]
MPNTATVTQVERAQVGEGVGMMAELSRLILSYDSDIPTAPTSVVAKYASQNPTNREIAISYNLYEREVRYYAELDSLTTAKCPRIYLSAYDGENMLILMEDMNGYEVGNQVTGATLKQAEVSIDEMAKLHASFWNEVSDLEWTPHIANSYHADNMYNLAHAGWDNMVTIFADYVSPSIIAIKTGFLSSIAAMQQSRDSEPLTFCHGDFRMENLFFGVQPDHYPLAIIDWQGPLIARGMVDVALFMGQSVQTEVRRTHEHDLLARYVDGLVAHGVTDYDLDFAWEDYLHSILYNWLYVAVVAGTLDVSNEASFAWMSKMVKRQVAATEDHELFKLLPYT